MRSREFKPLSGLKGLMGNVVHVVNLAGTESRVAPGPGGGGYSLIRA